MTPLRVPAQVQLHVTCITELVQEGGGSHEHVLCDILMRRPSGPDRPAAIIDRRDHLTIENTQPSNCIILLRFYLHPYWIYIS